MKIIRAHIFETLKNRETQFFFFWKNVHFGRERERGVSKIYSGWLSALSFGSCDEQQQQGVISISPCTEKAVLISFYCGAAVLFTSAEKSEYTGL